MPIEVPPLSPFQKRIFYRPPDKRHLLCVCCRQIGKSFCGPLEVLRAGAIPGVEIVWCSGTTDDAEKNWRKACDYLEPYCARFAPEKGILRFANGSWVNRISAGSKGGVQGMSPILIIIDEAQTVPYEFISTSFPSLSVSYGSLLVYANPPKNKEELSECERWMKPIIDNHQDYPEWLVATDGVTPENFAFMLKVKDVRGNFTDKSEADMLEIAKQEIENQRHILEPNDFARNWESKWVFDVEHRVLYEFHADMHANEKFDYDPDNEGEVYWFMDEGGGGFGKSLCLFAQIQKTRPGIVVFDEIYMGDWVDYDDFISDCLYLSENKNYALPRMVFPDVRAKGIIRALQRAKLPHHSKNRPVTEGVSRLNSGFNLGWIRINPRCKNLIRECSDWKYQKKGDTSKPRPNGNDGPDALKYGYEPLADKHRTAWEKLRGDDKKKLVRKPRSTAVAFHWF